MQAVRRAALSKCASGCTAGSGSPRARSRAGWRSWAARPPALLPSSAAARSAGPCSSSARNWEEEADHPGPGRPAPARTPAAPPLHARLAEAWREAWRVLSAGAIGLARLLLVAAACCLASLLPRPASALAAASHTAPHAVSRSCDPGSTSSSSSSCAVAPCRAAFSQPSGRSGSTEGVAGRTAAAPADASLGGASSSSSCSTGASRTPSRSRAPPLADLAAAPAAAAAALPYLESPGDAGAGPSSTALPAGGTAAGGTAAGGAAGSSGAGHPAVAAVGAAVGAAVDPEDAALAAQLGLGVSEAAAVRLFERHRASVVNITGMRAMQTFTSLDVAKLPSGQGSGFIWGDKGHVVTAYHLVKGAAEVKVTLLDNTSYTAKVLGYDAAKNIAVLKLSVPKSKLRELQPVTPGSASSLRVGQTLYGIGNPWGLGHTMGKGLVCGLGLELSAGLFPIKGVILTDAAADAGSSGGVLLDSKGGLVGMVVSPPAGGGNGGRCFAVPLDAVRGLIAQILAYGRTVRPALGVTMAPAQVLERVGVEGVLVLEVPPGSPAHAAGLRPTHRDIFGDLVLGDVLVALDGRPVRSAADVYDLLDEHRVGDRVKLDVLRDGKAAGLTVTLGERVLGAVEE